MRGGRRIVRGRRDGRLRWLYAPPRMQSFLVLDVDDVLDVAGDFLGHGEILNHIDALEHQEREASCGDALVPGLPAGRRLPGAHDGRRGPFIPILAADQLQVVDKSDAFEGPEVVEIITRFGADDGALMIYARQHGS